MCGWSVIEAQGAERGNSGAASEREIAESLPGLEPQLAQCLHSSHQFSSVRENCVSDVN